MFNVTMKLCDVSVRAENRQESFPGFSLLNQQCSMLQPFTQKTKNSHTRKQRKNNNKREDHKISKEKQEQTRTLGQLLSIL